MANSIGFFHVLAALLFGALQAQSIIYPRIEIQSWITNFEDEAEEERGYRGHSWAWEYDNLTHVLKTGLLTVTRRDEYLTYVVSQHIERLRISCTAPYPITWVSPQDPYHPDALYSYIFGIYDKRIVKNVRDSSTFSYMSTLEIYDNSGMATRNYTCQSLSSVKHLPSVERSLYVYWEGNTYLVYAGEVLDVKSTDEVTLVLPCKVSRPDISVYLFKETANGYEELLQNTSITFHPINGFTLKLNELKDPYGRYECISEDDSDSDELDSLRLNVLRGIQKSTVGPISFNQTIHSNASLKYDSEKQQIYCCSSGAKAPNLKLIYCRNELSCKMKEHLLYKIASKPPKSGVNGSCSIFDVYPRESGILRCKGDGIDVFHHYFTGLQNLENQTFLTYFKRSDAIPGDMMSITSSFEDYHLYSGQNFTAYCDASDYYFIKGQQWAIIWKNNSIQFLDEPTFNPSYTSEMKPEPYQDFDTVQIIAEYDMYSVVCYAPIWNSSNYWAKKELVLDVQESSLPEVSMVEFLTWNLNDTNQEIECRLKSGVPKPFVKWRKNNKSLIHDENVFINRTNTSSIVKFHYVSYETQGNYSCIAINFAGRVYRTITIHVQQGPNYPSSSTSTNDYAPGIFTFFITALMSGLVIGIGILVWKLKLQKKIIDHLAGVVFRDVAAAENGGAALAAAGSSVSPAAQQQWPPNAPRQTTRT